MKHLTAFVLALTLAACGSSGSKGGTKDVPATETAPSDLGTSTDPGPAPDDTPEPVDPGPSADTSPTACPHVDLGSVVPTSYTGTTDGLPNLVESNRLEWTDAPDAALRFEASSDGDYTITLTSDNASLGASAEAYTGTSAKHVFHTLATCPAPGAVPMVIDGVYNHNNPDYPLPLKAGAVIVIWVSAPYWADEKTGSYTLTVAKK